MVWCEHVAALSGDFAPGLPAWFGPRLVAVLVALARHRQAHSVTLGIVNRVFSSPGQVQGFLRQNVTQRDECPEPGIESVGAGTTPDRLGASASRPRGRPDSFRTAPTGTSMRLAPATT